MKKIFLLLPMITLFMVGCSIDDVYEPLKDSIQEQENNKFTLSDDKGYSDDAGYAYYIEGTVKNNTNKDYSYVQIEFNVYDKDGSIIGSCFDNINNLEGNGTWKIKAICLGESNNVKSYKLIGFSSW